MAGRTVANRPALPVSCVRERLGEGRDPASLDSDGEAGAEGRLHGR